MDQTIDYREIPHKSFKEWNNKCACGRVVGIDKDHSGNTLWQIRYEADGEEEDYDKSDMIQYVIRTAVENLVF
jgi:hypothetical protein